MLNRRTVVLSSIGIGVALEIVVSLVSGRREAWDSGFYWTVGLPAALLASVGIGWKSHERDWFATILIVPAQVTAMMVRSLEIGGLFPLTVALSAILSAPFVGAAWLGSLLRSRASR
jgi:hypothetical protein